jgi:LacI family transcriptional regulator, repressor for deo operon, udp, cdd, tsx, nupC, and nupG
MANKSTNISRVTSKDVAALAGVSQSTVSRVLGSSKANGFISEETASKVRMAAEQLGYSPHPIARALRGERTNLLSLIVREIADPFFARMIELLSAETRKLGLSMVLGYARSDPKEVLTMTQVFDFRQYDGMIFLGDLRNDQDVLQKIRNNQIPAVALCRGKKVIPFPTVNCDNTAGINMMVDYVIGLGHRRLAFIDGGWFGDNLERREAFLAYKDTHATDAVFNWVQADINDFDGGYKSMQNLLHMYPRPTAILTADDSLAIGALKAAMDNHIRVPEEISITGFDDIELASYTCPSLTTIRQPLEAMINKALEILVAQINGEAITSQNIITMDPELIVRASTTGITKLNSHLE